MIEAKLMTIEDMELIEKVLALVRLDCNENKQVCKDILQTLDRILKVEEEASPRRLSQQIGR